MWDLNSIVRMNEEAQRRADAIRDYEERERLMNEREVLLVEEGLVCPLNGKDEQAA